MGRADEARRGVMLPSHPPQFLPIGKGHPQPSVAAGNGAFDRDFSGHSPNITTTAQGRGFGDARRVFSVNFTSADYMQGGHKKFIDGYLMRMARCSECWAASVWVEFDIISY